MVKSLAQIHKEIESLKRQAEQIRKAEISGVIAKMKEAIRHYQLTPEELGFVKAGTSASRKKVKVHAAKPTGAKYRDPSSGRTWTGHGRRPQWFVDAVNAGKKPEELTA